MEDLVPGAGFEPARSFERQLLRLVCLPFHHPGEVLRKWYVLRYCPSQVVEI